jgi:hypothetical protein
MNPPRLIAAIHGKTPANNPASPCDPVQGREHVPTSSVGTSLANIILVFAPSRGVVTAIAKTPAKAPHTADCQESTI